MGDVRLPSRIDETCAASSGNFLPTFRDSLSVPSSTAVTFVKTSLSDLTHVLRTPTNICLFPAKCNAVIQNGRVVDPTWISMNEYLTGGHYLEEKADGA